MQCSRLQSYHDWRIREHMDEDSAFVALGGSAQYERFLQDLYATKSLVAPPSAQPPKTKKARGPSKKAAPPVAPGGASPPRTRGRAAAAGPSVKALGKRPAREPFPEVEGAASASAVQGAPRVSDSRSRKKARLIPDTPQSPPPDATEDVTPPPADSILGDLDFDLDVDLRELHDTRSANTRLQKDNDNLRAMLRQAREAGRDLQYEQATLQTSLQAAEQARLAAEQSARPAQTRATELQRRLTATTGALTASQDQLGLLRAELRDTQASLAAAEKKLADTEERLRVLQVCYNNQANATVGAEAERDEIDLERARAAVRRATVHDAREPPYEGRLAQARPETTDASGTSTLVVSLRAQITDLERSLALAREEAEEAADAPCIVLVSGIKRERPSSAMLCVSRLASVALADIRGAFVALLSNMLEQGAAWVDTALLPSDASAGVLVRFGQ
ncbi:hypothetical protein PLICRDRAFT_32917 [Plicaturopsis crispa FD-325 SS-3]|uniref:Unplaced genomic scaffold PLICRscaffold_24, whole genome shotgun sequence n=1 Tax=Plicaturopsis crispa FD-325 SS-3 TaxID=944288 RepID=A0A0C9T5W4_PLICR|nr:hypothetical protein PLICRDRAFT_32917 [Plicaturopsis crispa FD-325 SS-3]